MYRILIFFDSWNYTIDCQRVLLWKGNNDRTKTPCFFTSGHPGSAVFSLFFIHAVTVSAWHICNGYGMSLLCNHWQFLLGISAMAKPNQTDRTNQKPKEQKNKKTRKQKKNKKNDKTYITLCHYFPFGVCNLVFFGFLVFFFWFLVFLVFWFLVFWFVVGGLKGGQTNTKVKDLGLTLCQFSHFRDRPNKPKTKQPKNKMTRPNSLPLVPFWGVQSCFFWFSCFFFCFFGVLVSCFLVRCWWFEGRAKQHKSEGPRPHSLPVFPL